MVLVVLLLTRLGDGERDGRRGRAGRGGGCRGGQSQGSGCEGTRGNGSDSEQLHGRFFLVTSRAYRPWTRADLLDTVEWWLRTEALHAVNIGWVGRFWLTWWGARRAVKIHRLSARASVYDCRRRSGSPSRRQRADIPEDQSLSP